MLDEVVRARCSATDKARLLRLLQSEHHRGRDEAALLRMALEDFLTSEEGRLGLTQLPGQALREDAPPYRVGKSFPKQPKKLAG